MPLLSALEGAASTIYSNLFIDLPVPKHSLNGQYVIISGSNQGLGFEACRHVLALGAERLIMAVRSIEKGEEAKKKLLEYTGRSAETIEIWHLDMDQYSSVKEFAARASNLPRLDALVPNAGLATTEFNLSEENERTITVNVVSTFLLILLLVPKLRESARKFGITPRVTVPNSALHYIVPMRELDPHCSKTIFSRLNDKDTANMAMRYPMSKLLVIFAVRSFAERLEKTSAGQIIINTPNPSYCKSQLMRENEGMANRVGERLLARTTEMGSRAIVHGLLADKSSNGQYLTNCQVHK